MREFACLPSSGTTKGVHYVQSMGRIMLKYVLRDEAASLCAGDLCVELSSWELKVKAPGRQDLDGLLAPVSGTLYGDVRRDLSWWTLETQDGANVLTIELAKRDHKAWNAVWKLGLSHHRKSHFDWTPAARTSVKKAEDMLVKVKPGHLQRKQDSFVVRREDLCSALEDGQDDKTAIFRIHLDKASMEKACETTCLADLFGVDVMEQYFKVFIRGDEKSPILMGQLFDKVVPDKTRWDIVKAAAPVEEESPVRKSAQYNTCLQVTLTKAKPSKKHWPQLLEENELVLQREAAPQIEDLHAKALRAPSPDRSSWSPKELAQDFKAKADGCFRNSAWRDAAVYYTRALNQTPEEEKLFSNRSACYVKLKKFDKALADAKRCVSLKPDWPKAYFRLGQAHRGLKQWEEAIDAFREGLFREPSNKEWAREIEKTEEEQERWDAHVAQQRKLKREADNVTELNEATVVAEREAMVAVAEQAIKAGKSRKEAGELALKGAELAKQRVHDMAAQKKKAMMVEDDQELDAAAPYRIVCEDGSLHSKSFAHTDKGMYFMGMTFMNYKAGPTNQPWIEIRHPGKLRWSQGCAVLRLKVTLPETIRGAQDVDVELTASSLRIGTVGDTDPIIEGKFDRKVDPNGENYSWFLIPEEVPPIMELTLDKDASEVYQTYSYGTLLWPRLFNDDIPLGEGLFEADLTDLPPHLLQKFQEEQEKSDQKSREEKQRRQMMTEEEVAEETARLWNDEFARHGIPHRVDSMEDRRLESFQK
ncbi:HOP2 [Symbiodinium natans]|uniref:HOP2 protein n=1 Tax=Symbiodinium natans TaxID=878477 RepID=A0A812R2P3_9DINO|nr:HOP2 [Symbiodinium natans]